MPVEKREPVESNSYIYIKNNDGSLIPFPSDSSDAKKNITIKVSDYPNMQSIIVKNDNTGKEISLSSFQSFNPSHANGYEPVNPVSIAQDAKLKYEGITMTRSTNKIDDIVPNVTLTLESPTEKTAVITIKPDTEKAKDELITFVGRYNQLLAEINILTQSKPEIISELEYFTKEKAKKQKRLGSLRTEFSLTNSKVRFRI